MTATTMELTVARPGPLRERRARATSTGPSRAPSGPVAARRSAVAGFFAVIAVVCAVWAQAGGGSGVAGRAGSGPLAVPGAGPTRVVSAPVVVVQPGDTLWAIARRVQPSGDIRPLVDRLSAQLHGGALQVGQRIVLP